MSRGGDTRFQKGQSGNPAGRPKQRRPHVSAFDIIFDKTLIVTQNGTERQLTVDEALQLQTYQAALKGSKLAMRAVLKMIEKRELALAARNPPEIKPARQVREYDSDNANRAMEILGIGTWLDLAEGARPENRPFRLYRWASQAALSRPGRKALSEREVSEVKRLTLDPDKLRWPRRRRI